MRTIKILNVSAGSDGFYELFFTDEHNAYLIKDDKKINAKLTEEKENYLKLYWHHVNAEQKYIKLSKDCVVKIPLFEKFFPKKYLVYNQDLAGKNDVDLYNHYINDGITEGRIYNGYKFKNCKIEHSVKLPDDFNPVVYRSLNVDICNFSNEESEQHYLIYGFKEKRAYKYEFEKEHYLKFSPIFINHDMSLTGAPIFLYDLVSYLINNNIISNPIIVEPRPSNLFDKYGIKNKLYHYNDPAELIDIIEKINPVFIYSNSLNLMFLSNYLFKNFFHKTFFHLHESLENINRNLLKIIKDEKIFSVAEKIKQQFLKENCKNISLFPPFIDKEKIYRIKSLSKVKTEIKNEFRRIDDKKIIIGMSGSISFRKNFLLFYELSKNFPEYEFLWIGGEKDWKKEASMLFSNERFEELSNFFYIPYTNNPYKYLSKIDYFFLTSKNDPCPIVVLEALLLNKNIITIENTIFYDHSKYLDKDNYIIIDSINNNKDILKKFKKLSLSKNIKNEFGENYIFKNFSSPKILQNKSIKNKNYFIFSYYYDQNKNLNDIDYYINLINMFNINQFLEYNVVVSIKIDGIDEDVEAKNYYKKLFFNKFKNTINLFDVIILSNKGWDVAGLTSGIKKIYDSGILDDNSKLAYLHNKSNVYWREELIKIFYCQKEDIDNNNTTVAEHFFVECPKNDPNRKILKSHKIFNELYKKTFNYIQGNVFITDLCNLKPLYDNHEYICENFTDVNKKDDYWISVMKDKKIFQKYFDYYKQNKYNTPIDEDSYEIVNKNLANNFIDLYQSFGKKGIPDCHFEHAMERYIGYLISHGKKIKKIK